MNYGRGRRPSNWDQPPYDGPMRDRRRFSPSPGRDIHRGPMGRSPPRFREPGPGMNFREYPRRGWSPERGGPPPQRIMRGGPPGPRYPPHDRFDGPPPPMGWSDRPPSPMYRSRSPPGNFGPPLVRGFNRRPSPTGGHFHDNRPFRQDRFSRSRSRSPRGMPHRRENDRDRRSISPINRNNHKQMMNHSNNSPGLAPRRAIPTDPNNKKSKFSNEPPATSTATTTTSTSKPSTGPSSTTATTTSGPNKAKGTPSNANDGNKTTKITTTTTTAKKATAITGVSGAKPKVIKRIVVKKKVPATSSTTTTTTGGTTKTTIVKSPAGGTKKVVTKTGSKTPPPKVVAKPKAGKVTQLGSTTKTTVTTTTSTGPDGKPITRKIVRKIIVKKVLKPKTGGVATKGKTVAGTVTKPVKKVISTPSTTTATKKIVNKVATPSVTKTVTTKIPSVTKSTTTSVTKPKNITTTGTTTTTASTTVGTTPSVKQSTESKLVTDKTKLKAKPATTAKESTKVSQPKKKAVFVVAPKKSKVKSAFSVINKDKNNNSEAIRKSRFQETTATTTTSNSVEAGTDEEGAIDEDYDDNYNHDQVAMNKRKSRFDLKVNTTQSDSATSSSKHRKGFTSFKSNTAPSKIVPGDGANKSFRNNTMKSTEGVKSKSDVKDHTGPEKPTKNLSPRFASSPPRKPRFSGDSSSLSWSISEATVQAIAARANKPPPIFASPPPEAAKRHAAKRVMTLKRPSWGYFSERSEDDRSGAARRYGPRRGGFSSTPSNRPSSGVPHTAPRDMHAHSLRYNRRSRSPYRYSSSRSHLSPIPHGNRRSVSPRSMASRGPRSRSPPNRFPIHGSRLRSSHSRSPMVSPPMGHQRDRDHRFGSGQQSRSRSDSPLITPYATSSHKRRRSGSSQRSMSRSVTPPRIRNRRLRNPAGKGSSISPRRKKFRYSSSLSRSRSPPRTDRMKYTQQQQQHKKFSRSRSRSPYRRGFSKFHSKPTTHSNRSSVSMESIHHQDHRHKEEGKPALGDNESKTEIINENSMDEAMSEEPVENMVNQQQVDLIIERCLAEGLDPTKSDVIEAIAAEIANSGLLNTAPATDATAETATIDEPMETSTVPTSSDNMDNVGANDMNVTSLQQSQSEQLSNEAPQSNVQLPKVLRVPFEDKGASDDKTLTESKPSNIIGVVPTVTATSTTAAAVPRLSSSSLNFDSKNLIMEDAESLSAGEEDMEIDEVGSSGVKGIEINDMSPLSDLAPTPKIIPETKSDEEPIVPVSALSSDIETKAYEPLECYPYTCDGMFGGLPSVELPGRDNPLQLMKKMARSEVPADMTKVGSTMYDELDAIVFLKRADLRSKLHRLNWLVREKSEELTQCRIDLVDKAALKFAEAKRAAEHLEI